MKKYLKKFLEKNPKNFKKPLALPGKLWYTSVAVRGKRPTQYAAVAQLDRVTGYEPVGRGFESLQPYQLVASDKTLATSFFIALCVRKDLEKRYLEGDF